MTFQPSTGTFRLLGNIASSSTTTGTMIVTGGLGISGALYAGVIPGVSGYVPQNGGATLPNTDRKYIVSNTAGITLTLPLTSTDGRTITIVDGNNFGTFNVTLGRNTRLIGGLAENLVLNLQGSKVELVYRGGDWKVFAI